MLLATSQFATFKKILNVLLYARNRQCDEWCSILWENSEVVAFLYMSVWEPILERGASGLG